MHINVKVPRSGESISTANVARWHKTSGASVRQGEVLVSLETDKVTTELEAETSGIVEILIAEGKEISVGTVIARIETSASAAALVAVSPAAGAPVPPSADEAQPTEAAAPRTTRRKMSMLRRKIATRLVNAQQSAAILTTISEVDMGAVMEFRRQVQEDFILKHGFKLGLMSFFIKAAVHALKKVPAMNARIDGSDIIENHFYDISVAISTDRGLLVPVVRDCDRKSFAGIERDLAAHAANARAGKTTIGDLQGGVFTVTNGGVHGSLLSTPILNAPQSGILGTHVIQQRPVACEGVVVIRPMMYLALSYDHRLVDGSEAITFLGHVKASLEAPIRLILDGVM